MINSATVRSVTWRSIRGIGRSLLGVVSAVVLAYGVFQLCFVVLAAMFPLPLSSPLPFGETISLFERIPPVHLARSFTVDPVLNPRSLSTVVLSSGVEALGTLGIALAVPSPDYTHSRSTDQENSLPDVLSLHDSVVITHKHSHSEIARNATATLGVVIACVVLLWASINLLLPLFTGRGPVAVWILVILTLGLFLGAELAGGLGIAQTVRYARERWNTPHTAPNFDSFQENNEGETENEDEDEAGGTDQ